MVLILIFHLFYISKEDYLKYFINCNLKDINRHSVSLFTAIIPKNVPGSLYIKWC